jgi:hypothetical protein
MKDVPDDRHLQTGQVLEMLADREQVEERLSRMLVRTIAGVYDTGFDPLGQLVWCAR